MFSGQLLRRILMLLLYFPRLLVSLILNLNGPGGVMYRSG